MPDQQKSSDHVRRSRVSVRSVQRWRRTWENLGPRGLRSQGPAAYGWPDQRWTLSRIKTLIGRRIHKSFTLSGIAQMLHRHGFSHRVPARRAVERDEQRVTGWVKETWPQVGAPRRR
ncbi:winged helix-turn-helix domain-containing protein [Streptomyces sp. DG2A-72]|uniref:helix-turn-helix domain-containing protein n=1 Tax=Streptomyces sp. DG2A-72 TaxID=3051386 RepID=UPI00265C8A71|nr:winged helix-turn-helix domain-containing protein [Streptomyces sp. DG2A-72]MDO0938497.1 winged helix-turn-helix domain-containing protein [Streptomyces sp. DG2A-72]